MKRFGDLVKLFGLWTVPIILCGGAYAFMKLHPNKSVSMHEWLILILICFVCCLFIWNKNDIRIRNGKSLEDIGFLDFLSNKVEAYDVNDGKSSFTHPQIKNEMLFDNPAETSFILGKTNIRGKIKWVGIPKNSTNNHVLISGGSGSGKSSCQIIPNLLLRQARAKLGNGANYLVLDPKGELYEKTGIKTVNNHDIAFSPADRNCYGYDPLYVLNESSSEQEIYNCAFVIANSLIPKPNKKSGDNGPWIVLAQSMLVGFILYCYKYKKIVYLPNIVQYIISNPMEEILKEACTNVGETSIVRMSLQQFIGMSQETLYSVTATLFPRIKSFALDADLVWSLSNNPKKFRMDDLLNSSVFINIPLDKITKYASLIFLFINQFASWVYSLPENYARENNREIVLIIDETTAIFEELGDVPAEYKQLLRYGRSFGVSVVTAVQSISGLKTLMDDDSVNDVLSNMSFKLYLDCTAETDRLISSVGKFKAKKISYNKEGEKTESFELEDLLTPKEACELGQSDELICISNLGYFRFKKAPYYKEKIFFE